MFPPASLPLEPAIRNYADYRSSPEAWMLSRFICHSARLVDLGPYVSLFSQTSPLSISALGRPSQSIDDFIAGLRETLQHITAFRAAHGPCVSVDALELPLPPNPNSSLFSIVSDLIESHRSPDSMLVYEITAQQAWQPAAEAALNAIAAHNAQHHWKAGFKLRTGGVTADVFPSPGSIAWTIVACRDRGVALKFTAGLHHPLRRYDDSVQTKVHGFLNAFAAGVLAHVRSLDRPGVQAILEDKQADHFQFDSGGFAWQGLRASIDEIAIARRTAILSFGSCSFDEPRDDLRTLGWLPGEDDGRDD